MNWIAGWNKRIKLTISGSCIEGDLSNFPIMVHLDSTCSGVFNEVGSNSKRIAVVDSNQQQCYVEIENWDESTNNAWLWVQVPTLSSGVNSDVCLYYDNLQSDNSLYVGTVGETPAQNVWDSNFKGVWHLPFSGTSVNDSTVNANDGTLTSSSIIAGKIGKAINMANTVGGSNASDYVTIPYASNMDFGTGDFTLSMWLRRSSTPSASMVLISMRNVSTLFDQVSITSGGFASTGNRDSGGNYLHFESLSSVCDGSWHRVVITRTGATRKIYIDDASPDTDTNQNTGDTWDVDVNLIFGYASWTTGQKNGGYNGDIDEVRLAHTLRSAEWIKASYYSGRNQLLNYGNEETVSSGILPCWNNRLKLTIQNDHIDNTLTDFPVMIKLSEDSGFNSYDNRSVFYELETNINRKKIAITDSTGVAQCFVEIERFSCAETEAVLWTKLPVIYANTGTHFYLYYDKSKPDNVDFVGDVNSIVAQNVWDSNFVGVWHMNQDPSGGSGCIKESTSNANHGTSGGSMVSGDLVDGKVGKALDFDGSNDYINCGHGSSLDITSAITIEITVNRKVINVFHRLVSKRGGTNGYDLFIGGVNPVNNDLTFDFYSNDVIQNTYGPDVLLGWKHAVVTYDQTDVIFYVNGVGDSYSQSGAIDSDVTGDLFIGIFCNGTTAPFNGLIDETRISNTVRSAPWIKATYHSNWDSLVVYEKEDISASWLSNWAKRIKLTINHTKIDSSLIDFPVLVTLTSGVQSDFFSEMLSSDSKKIAVTKNNGITQCYVEIEQFDITASGKVNLWTKIPTIVFDVNTDIYLYYDKIKDDNVDYVGDIGSIPAQNVWDSSFVGVWHMNQDPSGGSGCIKDSTSNANHGTPGGSMVSGDLVDGKVGKALDFDGGDDYINAGSASLLDDIDQRTLEAIIKLDTFGEGGGGRLFYKNQFQLYLDQTNTRMQFYQKFDTTHGIWVTPNNSVDIGIYYNFGVVYDRSLITNDAKIFLNGISQTITETSIPAGGVTSDAAESLYFGNRSSSDKTFDGILDEFRISNMLRSDAWLKATYHSNWNTLLTQGSVQTYTPPPDYYYHGYVKEKGAYVTRKVYLYKRNTGALIDSCMSNASTGYYLLETSVSGEHFIVALDDDAGDTYNALVEDRLYPNDM